jgi:hypothetical protein
MTKPSTAAINMRDQRKVYNYLIHDEQAPFQTKPMPILPPEQQQQEAGRQTQMSRQSQGEVMENHKFMIRSRRMVDGKVVITEQGTYRSGMHSRVGLLSTNQVGSELGMQQLH